MIRTGTVVSASCMSGQSTGATSNGEMTTLGRWPANLIHDGSDEVTGLFPSPHGAGKARKSEDGTHRGYHDGSTSFSGGPAMRFGDTGSASRFFYCAKTSKADRDEGNHHPTVKPTDLMRYLCRLVTQPGGTVLDPFCGSGSTGKAATLEGFRFIGIEIDSAYAEIAERRINHVRNKMPLLSGAI
jgi:site-specific DNA-methyltransferase (adenine-specific)